MNSRQPEKNAEKNMSALIAAIRAGDQQAFTELYEATHQEVYRTARAVLRSEEMALDVQQDTYVFAYTHLDQLSDPDKIRPWLRSIAVNRARSLLRKQTPVLFTELETEEGESTLPEQADLSPEASPELSLERKETAELVNEILGELSDGQRAAVAMYYYEQMPVKQIAEALGISEGTVKAQLAKGRKKIEEAVRRLEKRGIKLYGLSPLPFLLALMKGQRPAAEAGRTVLTKTLAQTGLSAGVKAAAGTAGSGAAANVGSSVALHVGRRFFETAAGKLVLGVIVAGVIGGSVAGYHWYDRHMKDRTTPVLNLATNEDLTTAPTIPVEIETTELPNTDAPNPGELLSGTCGEDLTWTLNLDTGLLTIEGSGTMTDYDWDNNRAPWADYHNAIKALSLREGLTSIGSYAFEDCPGLERVELPEGVVNVKEGAFQLCSSLRELRLPDSLTDIGSMAFCKCTALTDVTIPEHVSQVGSWLFEGCTSLETVSLPAGLQELNYGLFEDCERLTDVTLPEGLQVLSEELFKGCTGLKEIELPAGLQQIARGAFNGCAALENLRFPETLREIGDSAFFRCTGLETLTIPDGLLSIGEDPFEGCSHLREITVSAGNPNYSSVNGILFNKAQYELLRYPAGKTESAFAIPDGVTEVGTRAFSGCENLKNITFPADMLSIGQYAFEGCIGLTELRIPEGTEGIPEGMGGRIELGLGAFARCTGLKTVHFPASLTAISPMAFLDCTGLTELDFPEGVELLGENAFYGCTALTEVRLPESLEEIGGYAFANCSKLTGVTVPHGVETIGEYALGYFWRDDAESQGAETVEGFTVYAAENSAAQRYAEENGLLFSVR